MRYKAVVFDFDGTLVDSNDIKRQGFFDLFPRTPEHASCVEEALANANDNDTRYQTIPRMIEHMRGKSLPLASADVSYYVKAYDRAMIKKISHCPELEGATQVIMSASQSATLFVSSNTPETSLLKILRARGWSKYITRAYGYPRSKPETLATILAETALPGASVAVVGDGESDENAARRNCCAFFRVDSGTALLRIAAGWTLELS